MSTSGGGLIAREACCGGLVVSASRGGARPFAEPGARPRYAPDRGFDIARIDLLLQVDPTAQTLVGEARIQVLPLPAGLGEVVFDLDDVDVDDVQDADGNPLAHRYGDGRLKVSGLPDQGGLVVVRYHGSPRRGMYFTGPTDAHPERPAMAWTQCQDEDGHFVFPCLDHPGIKHPWTITIDVQGPGAAQLEAVGNGRLKERDGTRWVWEQVEPIPAYLVTVVVGPVLVVEDQPVDLGPRSIPLRYIVPARDTAGRPADPAQVRRVFGRSPAMLRYLSEQLGTDFPWPRYDQVVVHDFIFGGMENVAATTLTDVVLTSERAALDTDFDDLLVHELMHQWFGDLLTCQDWSQGWLNEGWATYGEYLWKAHAEGDDEADWHQWSNLSTYLEEDGGRYRRAIVSYRFREPIDLFDRHLYQKASLVIHTLRSMLGERAFWSGVQSYLAQHAWQVVHSRDFQRALEGASGRSLEGFFRQWIHGAGHPELTVTLSHDDGLLRVEVEQGQSAGPVDDDPDQVVAEAFELVLPITVVHGASRQTHRLPIKSRTEGFALPCADAPDRVEVDAALTILADLKVKAPRDWLVASLSADGRMVGRIRAARALAEEGSPQAVRALIAAYRDEPFWGVRAEVARLLGKRGGDIARQALVEFFDDPHPKARRAVASALASMRDPDIARLLADRARDGDPSLHVEGACVLALGGFVADGLLDLQPTRQLLDDVLARDSWTELLAQRALSALGATRSTDVLPTLLSHTDIAHPDRVRAAAASALGQLAEELPEARRRAVDRLMVLARDGSSWRVTVTALNALGRARDSRAQPVLRHVHATALEGRLRRTAWEASERLSRSQEDAVGSLRREVEELRREGKDLRGRLDRLQGKLDADDKGSEEAGSSDG